MPSWRRSLEKRLINRDFARLWYGAAISSVGDYVFDTTLVLWVAVKLGAGKAWAPAAVSGLLLAAVIAIVVVGPIAGVWVDRWNRKRTMLGTEAARGRRRSWPYSNQSSAEGASRAPLGLSHKLRSWR
jgi:MFS family permease